jgi:hypothetical protein
MSIASDVHSTAESFTLPTLIKGQPAEIQCRRFNGQVFEVSSGALRTVRLLEEWYEDVRDPRGVIESFTRQRLGDIFTFVQRYPDTPAYDFYREDEQWAVLPITTFDAWWTKEISSRTRSLIRKSQKSGLDVRVAEWNDDFVNGMTAIFNETPVRQGRPFWHFGKSAERVKQEFSRYLHRETLIGAYFDDQLVGFMMLADAGRFALTGQILSFIAHRDKSPNNALIAKAVEVCAERGTPALVYLHWGSGDFAEFKRRCGFQCVTVPRYYVPLTFKGRCALAARLHDGYRSLLPASLLDRAKNVRKAWYERRQG